MCAPPRHTVCLLLLSSEEATVAARREGSTRTPPPKYRPQRRSGGSSLSRHSCSPASNTSQDDVTSTALPVSGGDAQVRTSSPSLTVTSNGHHASSNGLDEHSINSSNNNIDQANVSRLQQYTNGNKSSLISPGVYSQLSRPATNGNYSSPSTRSPPGASRSTNLDEASFTTFVERKQVFCQVSPVQD